MELIRKYFPTLSERQYEQFEQIQSLYEHWNSQINVISRKDMDQLYTRHVLHSLAIAKLISFKKDSQILDVGTGGGFPGIPLAILNPESSFHLVDSIGKKIKVVKEVSASLGLTNVRASHTRVEQVKDSYDFIVSRAVTGLTPFYAWVKNNLKKKGKNDIPNGLLALKGGDLEDEIQEFKNRYPKRNVDSYSLTDYFEEDFFETKKLLHVY